MEIRRFSLSTYALLISLFLHLLLFFLSFPQRYKVTDSESTSVQIPVSLSIIAPPMSRPMVQKHVAMPTVESPHRQETAAPPKAVEASTKPAPPVHHEASSGSGSESGQDLSKGLPGDRASAGTTGPVFAVYPKSALNNDWTGTIVAEFDVDEDGRVIASRVIKSTGHDVLDHAFIRAVKATRFEPKRVMGKAISDTVRLSYEFKLQ